MAQNNEMEKCPNCGSELGVEVYIAYAMDRCDKCGYYEPVKMCINCDFYNNCRELSIDKIFACEGYLRKGTLKEMLPQRIKDVREYLRKQEETELIEALSSTISGKNLDLCQELLKGDENDV